MVAIINKRIDIDFYAYQCYNMFVDDLIGTRSSITHTRQEIRVDTIVFVLTYIQVIWILMIVLMSEPHNRLELLGDSMAVAFWSWLVLLLGMIVLGGAQNQTYTPLRVLGMCALSLSCAAYAYRRLNKKSGTPASARATRE